MVEDDAPQDREPIRDVETTHRAFYAAWEAADIAAAAQLWLDSEDISIAFPGGSPTWGREAVLEQLAEAMDFTRGIQFLFEDLRFAVQGDVARLTCIEHVLMPGDRSFEEVAEAPLSRLAVSSTLVRTEVGWRLWSHMSGPILTDVERE
ncbi:nuclear transport factor 2 family protein [Nocardioides daedukensis]|nr:nuclear transport factor 2 family protein [Nocardioides daedukensis]